MYQGHVAQPATISVDEQRRNFWRDLTPLIQGSADTPGLSDMEISLIAVLLFWSGPDSVPGTAVRKSLVKICQRIGSRRDQGARSAKRSLVTMAAKQLVEIGLLRRQPDDCLWTLLPASVVEGPDWPGLFDYNSRLWRRESVPGGLQVRATATRLSFALDENGQWTGDLDQLAAVIGVKSLPTVERRLIELQRADNSITLVRNWQETGETLAITFKAPESLPSPAELRTQALQMREQLWHPDLVDDAIKRSARKLKTGKITPARAINGFYRPVLELQAKFGNPPLIKYALEQTLAGPVFKGQKTAKWHRYALRVAENNRWRFPKAGDAAENSQEGTGDDLRALELATRDKLTEAAQLNGSGDHGNARELLGEVLEQAGDLAPLFDGDEDRSRRQLQLAFKQGSTDFVGVKEDEYAFDYLPEWSPEN